MPALRPEPASAHGCRRKESHDRRKNPECEELSSLVSCNLGGSARRQPRGCSGSDATCPVGLIYTHAKKCPAWTGRRHRLKERFTARTRNQRSRKRLSDVATPCASIPAVAL